MLEMNTLMTELQERRLGALEATALLQRVMAEIDVAVFAFDDAGALRLVNARRRAAARPAGRAAARAGARTSWASRRASTATRRA